MDVTPGPLPPAARGRVAAGAAAVVALGSAAVSAYWAAGGTGLLDTVGGVFERAGRSGGAAVAASVWALVAVKVIAAAVPMAATTAQAGSRARRAVRSLGWLEALVLTGYGLVLTVVGLLVQAGVIHTGPGADQRALAWHAYLWDPWFLVWGLLVGVALGRSRRRPGAVTSGAA